MNEKKKIGKIVVILRDKAGTVLMANRMENCQNWLMSSIGPVIVG